MNDPLLKRAADQLRPIPDWPKEGITFYDLNPVLHDIEAAGHLADLIAERWRDKGITFVAMLDARGFILGSMVAERLGASMTMIRKKGKLPPPTLEFTYDLEYGTATVEIANDGSIENEKALVFDDLLATGGTAEAAVKLVEMAGGTVVGFACVTELPELGGREKLLTVPVQSLITIMDGEKLLDVEYCVDIYTRMTESGELVLLERLGEVPGIAMPGGRIEDETALEAGYRELKEETGLNAWNLFYAGMLTGIKRDPRGPKVSVVLEAKVHKRPMVAEAEKTRPFICKGPSHLPDPSEFVFGHGEFVHERWTESLEAA